MLFVIRRRKKYEFRYHTHKNNMSTHSSPVDSNLSETVRLALKQPEEIRRRIRRFLQQVTLIQDKRKYRNDVLRRVIEEIKLHTVGNKHLPVHLSNLAEHTLDPTTYNDLFPLMNFFDSINYFIRQIPRPSRRFYKGRFYHLMAAFDASLQTDASFTCDNSSSYGCLWITPVL